MIVVFDTETTGLADFRAAAHAHWQPRIVSLAAVALDGDWNERAILSCMVRPDGFEIPKEATAVHGISTLDALRHGVPIRAAMEMFCGLMGTPCVMSAAFNHDFDELLVTGELARLGMEPLPWERKFCVMRAATEVCRLPSSGRPGFKWPRLQEAYRHCFGEEFAGAHGAMADCRATARIFRWLQEHPKQDEHSNNRNTDTGDDVTY